MGGSHSMEHTRNSQGDVMDFTIDEINREEKAMHRERMGKWALVGMSALSLGLVVTAIVVGVNTNGGSNAMQPAHDNLNRSVSHHQRYVRPNDKHNDGHQFYHSFNEGIYPTTNDISDNLEMMQNGRYKYEQKRHVQPQRTFPM